MSAESAVEMALLKAIATVMARFQKTVSTARATACTYSISTYHWMVVRATFLKTTL